MRRTPLLVAVAGLILPLAGAATAADLTTSPSHPQQTSAEPASAPVGAASAGARAAGRRVVTAYVTGYTYYDNTPAGSAAISHPVVHRHAGGQGTYADPVTVAVGHRYVHGKDVLDLKRGTRMYVPYLRRYFVVEDTCGDGKHPERGPCHLHPKGTAAWYDVWLGGQGVGARRATRCAEAITGRHRVELNPPRGRAVSAGAVVRKGRCGR